MPNSNFTSLFIPLFAVLLCSEIANADTFTTPGNGIRNAVVGTVDGKEVLFASEIDGGVSCCSLDGKPLWQKSTETPAVMFKIVAADISGDGSDELLGASGDGFVIRLILIDPGFIDPQNRTANVTFQTIAPTSMKDILSGQAVTEIGKTTNIPVPAGSMRFFDIEH